MGAKQKCEKKIANSRRVHRRDTTNAEIAQKRSEIKNWYKQKTLEKFE
jgi:hypothetical protein